MKKIERLKLNVLKEKVQVLTVDEQRQFIAGDGTWRIKGGYLYEVDGGTIFCGDDDRFVWFPGVGVSTSYVVDGTAYQLNGTIHISEDWLDDGFDIYDFAHEYGHYLQQVEMGNWKYYKDVAAESAGDMITDPDNHSSQPYEQDATERGYNFLYGQGFY